MASAGAGATATHDSTAAGHPIARVLPLLSPAHLDRDFDYLVPPELDEIAQPGVRVRVRFAGRLVDGYLLARLSHSDHTGKMVKLERVVSAERVLTPEILKLATAVAARYAGTRADVLRLAIPPRHARTENGGATTAAAPSSPGSPSPDPALVTDSPALAADAVGPAGTPNTAAAVADSRDLPTVGDSPTWADSVESAVSDDAVAALEHSVDAPTVGGEDEAVDVRDRFGTAPVSSCSDGHVTAAGAGSESLSADSIESVVDSGAVTSARQDGVAAADGRVEAEPEDADAPVGERAVVADESANVVAVLADSGGTGMPDGVELRPWERYIHGAAFVSALGQGKGVRAGWQAVPGEDWARRLAELAAVVVGRGRSAILMVPDQRDLDRVLAECVRLVGDSAVGLAAGLGPAARYRRWLAALRGTARVIVGTRSAVFAPTIDLGLIAIWDDGDDTYAEPRAPYPHAREVAMLRAHDTGAAFVAAGFARTAEIQAVVDSGWAHDLVADRAMVRKFSPRISAPGDSDIAMERDPVARAVRIPAVGYAAARSALKEGAAVLVQVPRRGYIPALACAKCRTPARCRHCNGPLSLPDGRAGHRADTAHSPACRWCGITEAAFRCPACASRALRAVVIGAARTAEELGRAFPGVPIRGSSGGAVLDTVEPGPQVIVATVGAEPVLPGGYGVALLLDGWALLSRADLRAAEDTLRRWMSAATLVRNHGQVIVMAEPSLPTVQALLRWDPVGHARAEVAARAEVGFPPAVRMAAIDGTSDSIAELLSAAKLPGNVDILGPVPLPPGARKPFDSGDTSAEVERMLLRVHRTSGAALARALTAAQAVRSTHRSDAPLRVQIDPVDIG
ncbi:primosomal protein N' [Nocardia pseudovaccinii]|uniref:primosomal protein N' n=1 Tax=Nocardia pseudovaccinii TaxID=189540 RepID=UPI001FE1FADC|nr:primosomal protein N' [Nocardia pseudovaccinii]